MDALDILLEGLIDYAGLYPPASLPMAEAARNYAAYRSGPRAAWLGRFVLPVSRLAGFGEARAAAGPSDPDGSAAVESASRTGRAAREGSDKGPPGGRPAGMPVAWRLSALLGDDPDADLERVIAFNRDAHAAGTGAQALIDSVEMKPGSPGEILRIEALVPAGVAAYFEIPAREPGPWLAALAQGNGRAKLRAGGVVPEAVPAVADVARFLAACAAARVPFKATAGLHHPLRSYRPLTYAPDAPRAAMHGFLNVFLGAAWAREGMDAADLAALIGEESPAAFAFHRDSISWRGRTLRAERLREARRDFALAFGSCSFDEPRQDLEAAGWR